MNELEQFYAHLRFFIREGPKYVVPGKESCPEVTLDTLVRQGMELEPELWGNETQTREIIFGLRGMDLAAWEVFARKNPEGFKRLKSAYDYEEAFHIAMSREEAAKKR